jgi:alpha-D-ribose 1-methylphosphonate 5-triphosphate diphosphatase
MDHTPGQGQWEDVARFRRYYGARYGLSAAQIDDLILRRQASQRTFAASNRALSLAFAREQGCVIAGHDAGAAGDYDLACSDGCRLVEFPATLEAARRARELGASHRAHDMLFGLARDARWHRLAWPGSPRHSSG